MPPSRALFSHYTANRERIDWYNAYLLCLASKLVYHDAGRVTRTARGWGLEEPAVLSRTDPVRLLDTEVLVAARGTTAFVVFRGTEPDSIGDWLTDARIRQRSPRVYRGKVHRGFADALALVWRPVVADLRARFAAGAERVCVAGHSLGGALATLSAQRLHRVEKLPVDGLYTYGCPRAGDPEFRAGLAPIRKRLFRFENNNDIVPKVPPPVTLSYRYKHVSDPLYFYADGSFERNPSASDRRRDLFLGRLRGLVSPGIDGIDDHSLREYASLIKRQMSPGAKKSRMRPPGGNFW